MTLIFGLFRNIVGNEFSCCIAKSKSGNYRNIEQCGPNGSIFAIYFFAEKSCYGNSCK